MTTKYSIGDKLWRATFIPELTYVVCPDCGGTRFMTIVLFDDTKYFVDCRTCEHGYEGSQGRLPVYDRAPCAKPVTVTSVAVEDSGVRYNSFIDECDLFVGEHQALARAQEVADEATRVERERISMRHKDAKSWAWNATYHRGEIRKAQKSLEYHTSKLDVAKVRAKEDKKAEVS